MKDLFPPPEPGPLAYSHAKDLLADFASRGFVILAPESLGVPIDIHGQIFAKQKRAHDDRKQVTSGTIPEVLQIVQSPGVLAACNQLVGENWAIVPFMHNASFLSGSNDQAWHKDDNAPYNGRKHRHHQPVQIEVLYYPQAVAEDMGPTALVPYSHYWTFNHEENSDNFAGADHLDFDYQLNGMESQPVSGKNSKYSTEDILNRNTPHDKRMRDAITDLNWPLAKQFETAPLKPGSVVFVSHNTFHRGNHRRDDWRTWPENPRFMWRFWLYRTTDPGGRAPKPFRWSGIDDLTGIDLSDASDDVTEVWRAHYYWMNNGLPAPARPGAAALTTEQRQQEADRLSGQLLLKNDESEPLRIGAAYKLASIGDDQMAADGLGKALHNERETVRRAALYGLSALGPAATDVLIDAAGSAAKWVRRAAVAALGDAALLDERVCATVENCLLNDASVYVRSVAAGSLGCLIRRAFARQEGAELIPRSMEALCSSLEQEENRPTMDRVQGRSIKMVRPTDECDVCEGEPARFHHERLKPVRSAVRENVLWSMVIICSHGSTVLGPSLDSCIAALRTVILEDPNGISVGYAMDALNRLAHLHADDESPPIRALRKQWPDLLQDAPGISHESLIRGGLEFSEMSP